MQKTYFSFVQLAAGCLIESIKNGDRNLYLPISLISVLKVTKLSIIYNLNVTESKFDINFKRFFESMRSVDGYKGVHLLLIDF